MDADEKLTALKKAYADIILSISKEAAARVMSSERKSVRHQHELTMAKDEGLRMVMRLKKMMDSQISEAEAASLAKQKKIEELEAQLEEAEDIVSDLRQELGEAHAELNRVKNENLHQASKRFIPPKDSPVASDVYGETRDLPNIILRGKNPGLYRNGCTHRIRACERKILEADEEKDASKAPTKLEDKLCADVKLGRFQSFLMKRKRAIRRRKTILPLRAGSPEHNAHSDKEGNIVEVLGSKTKMPLAEVKGFSESLCSSDHKMEDEKVDASLYSLDSTKEVSNEPRRERVIKYTFQRKRKRQALSVVEESGSLEKEGKETGDGENGEQKMEESNSSLLLESSRESRRLAQVARQLISLSEKKWWD